MFKLTDKSISDNNRYSFWHYKEIKKNIEAYESDSSKERRVRINECKSCFYLKNGSALQAFTEYECRNCEIKQMWHNSRIPRYCNYCATEHQVCIRCGCSIFV